MSFFSELKRRNVFRVGFAYTVAAWLLIQVTDTVFPRIGLPDSAVTLVIALLAIGFVPALIFAWAFEMTPEGIKHEKNIDRTQSITQQTGRKLDRAVIVVLLLAVVLLLFDRSALTPEADTQAPAIHGTPTTETAVNERGNDDAQEPAATTNESSVAVLPFVNMSSDPEQEYFSDGISEEILNVLTRIPNLKVAARTSSFQFKGKNLDIVDIGKQLQVDHLLEGSVRKSGHTLRITAQLIETDTGFHLWSETFDRTPEDVFAIQDEIAAAIAAELRTLLSGKNAAGSKPIDLQAYELYLKGRGLVAHRRHTELLEGIDILKNSIEIEPEYAPAMATLAKAYAVLPWFSNEIPAGVARETARQWANKAMQLEPDNVEAMAVLAIVYSEVDLNFSGARKLLEKAVKLNPGSVAANNFLGDLLTRVGDLENGFKYESRAAELDPLSPVQLTDLANVHLMRGEYDKVINLANRALALDKTFLNAHQHLADAYYALGDMEQLIRVGQAFESTLGVMAPRVVGLQLTLDAVRGNRSQAEAHFEDLLRQTKAGKVLASDAAIGALALGDFDTAGELLMQAYREKDGTWIFPIYIRLPEQAPDSEPWQEFWRLPGVKELAEIRRSNGLSPNAPTFGSGARQ